MDSPVNFTKSFNSPDSVKQMKSFVSIVVQHFISFMIGIIYALFDDTVE